MVGTMLQTHSSLPLIELDPVHLVPYWQACMFHGEWYTSGQRAGWPSLQDPGQMFKAAEQ